MLVLYPDPTPPWGNLLNALSRSGTFTHAVHKRGRPAPKQSIVLHSLRGGVLPIYQHTPRIFYVPLTSSSLPILPSPVLYSWLYSFRKLRYKYLCGMGWDGGNCSSVHVLGILVNYTYSGFLFLILSLITSGIRSKYNLHSYL